METILLEEKLRQEERIRVIARLINRVNELEAEKQTLKVMLEATEFMLKKANEKR